MEPRFRDRTDAGRRLARYLGSYAERPDVVVVALPRGGVPVAYEIATALRLPLDMFVVRKLGVPGQEELAMGAIAGGGVKIINREVVDLLEIPGTVIDRVAAYEAKELSRREVAYRGSDRPIDVNGKTVIVVDDGLATGSTMRAAISALRRNGARQVVVAVPTADPTICEEFESEADDVICAMTPVPFHGVGLWYEDFSQTTDEEVRRLLKRAKRLRPEAAEPLAPSRSGP